MIGNRKYYNPNKQQKCRHHNHVWPMLGLYCTGLMKGLLIGMLVGKKLSNR
ncbi:hypothetical protein ACAG39_06680 [Caldicellulosiruptoraceae bacterium PP1]